MRNRIVEHFGVDAQLDKNNFDSYCEIYDDFTKGINGRRKYTKNEIYFCKYLKFDRDTNNDFLKIFDDEFNDISDDDYDTFIEFKIYYETKQLKLKIYNHITCKCKCQTKVEENISFKI